MIPLKLIKNAVENVNGILHYGDVIDAEIFDYEFGAVKKVIWIHPDNSIFSQIYGKVATKHFRSQYANIEFSNKDSQFTKRAETYITENIINVDLTAFNVIKINSIRNIQVDSKSIVEGFGNVFEKYPSIKAVSVVNDSREIEKLLSSFGFRQEYMLDQATLYVR